MMKTIGFSSSNDYVVDGIANNIEFNAALTALGSGGTLIVEEG